MRIPAGIPLYGDPSYRGDCNKEDTEQINFFAHLREQWPQYAAIAVHPKNEGRRSWGQARMDRKQGSLNTGASDIIIPASPPLVIELKRIDHTKSKLGREQLGYLRNCRNMGATACIALGYLAALQAVEDWHYERKGQAAAGRPDPDLAPDLQRRIFRYRC